MIVIVDYGLGNLKSIGNALERLETPFRISSSPSMMRKAKALILPGVGAAGQGMKNLKKNGLDKLIIDQVNKGKKILGICLGMQLLFEESEEGNTKCLGVFKGKVKKFNKMKKIPQIGWNKVSFRAPIKSGSRNLPTYGVWKIPPCASLSRDDILFYDIPNNSYFYFVNSYYCLPEDKSTIAGKTKYGEKFASIVVKNNIVGTQFHPEKSGKIGFQFLKNWKDY